MVSPRDIRPIFYMGRVFGTANHVVAEENIRVTRTGIAYTVWCTGVYAMTAIMNVYFFATDNEGDVKLLILVITRTVLSYLCLFTDITLILAWNYKIRAALSQLQSFDRATKFNESKSYRRVTWVCCLLVCSAVVFWAVVGYITYKYDTPHPLFNGILYGVINAAISMQILSFVAISLLVYVRFRQLCQALTFSGAEGKIMVVDRLSRQFKLQEIWWLHYCLVNATETINSVYAVQLLLWIASMSFNTLSRIYSINENGDMPIMLKVRESLLVTACVGNLLLITVICHTTASQANRVGKMLFTPLSIVVGKRNFAQDCVEAATYFQMQRVHFFAMAGLIRIDLPLLLSIASGITTYLVILHAANSPVDDHGGPF